MAVGDQGLRAPSLTTPRTHTAHTIRGTGNNESVEPFTSNMYSRRVLAGEFTVVNKYLLCDLIDRGLWTQEVRNQIMHDRGSVQNVAGMPQDLKVRDWNVGEGKKDGTDYLRVNSSGWLVGWTDRLAN